MSLTVAVSQNLKRERIRQKLTQTTLAGRAGVSVSYISMLERARRSPPLNTLEKLATALGTTPARLFKAA